MKKEKSRRVLPIALTLCLLSSSSVFAVAPGRPENSAAPQAASSQHTDSHSPDDAFAAYATVFRQARLEIDHLIKEQHHQAPAAIQPARIRSQFSFSRISHFLPLRTADHTRPSIWFNSPSNEQAVGADGTISVGAFDDSKLSSIQLTVVGKTFSKKVTKLNSQNGSLSVAVRDLGLPDGFYTLRAVATDTAGNRSVTADRNFKIDTTAPALSSVTFGSAEVKNGVVLTGSDTFTASFAEENPQRTYVEVDELVNGKWQKVQGQWSTGSAANKATLPVDTSSLKQYTQYQLKISCDDAAGNHTGYAAGFTVDYTAPSTWYNAPAEEQVIGAKGAISIGARDDVSLASIQVTVPGTNFSKTVTGIDAKEDTLNLTAGDLGLPDGSYTLRTVVTDTAGNRSVTSDRSFKIDTTAPALDSVTFGSAEVKNGVVLTGSDTFTASFAEENPQRTYVEVDELINGKWQKVNGKWTVTDAATGSTANKATLPVDTSSLKQYTQYQLKISCDDAAGNHTGYAAGFTVDYTAPSTWYNTPSNEQVIGAKGAISIGAHDDVSLASIQVTVPGTNFSKTVTGIDAKDDTPNLTAGDLGLPDGSYTLRTVVTDTAGNRSVTSDRNFKIDTTAPALDSVTFGSTEVKNGVVLTGSDIFTASFTEENPQRTYVEVDELVNGKWQKVNGQWTVTDAATGSTANKATLPVDTATLKQNTQYQLKISCDDAAGNHTGYAAGFTVASVLPQ